MTDPRINELLRNKRARDLAERVVALEDEVQRLERELAAVRSEGPLGKAREGEL